MGGSISNYNFRKSDTNFAENIAPGFCCCCYYACEASSESKNQIHCSTDIKICGIILEGRWDASSLETEFLFIDCRFNIRPNATSCAYQIYSKDMMKMAKDEAHRKPEIE